MVTSLSWLAHAVSWCVARFQLVVGREMPAVPPSSYTANLIVTAAGRIRPVPVDDIVRVLSDCVSSRGPQPSIAESRVGGSRGSSTTAAAASTDSTRTDDVSWFDEGCAAASANTTAGRYAQSSRKGLRRPVDGTPAPSASASAVAASAEQRIPPTRTAGACATVVDIAGNQRGSEKLLTSALFAFRVAGRLDLADFWFRQFVVHGLVVPETGGLSMELEACFPGGRAGRMRAWARLTVARGLPTSDPK